MTHEVSLNECVEYILRGNTHQGCEEVVIVFSHHAHEQNLQQRQGGKNQK